MGVLQLLETDRLILKPRSMDDFEACVVMDMDVEVTKYIPGVWDGSREHVAFLEERINGLYPRGLGYWSLFPRDNPADFLGWVHLLPVQGDEGGTEIGWRLKRSAWGRGYAAEAARGVLAYAFGVVGSKRVLADTHGDNERSRKVMERLGFRFVADFMYDGVIPSLSYEIAGDEFYRIFARDE